MTKTKIFFAAIAAVLVAALGGGCVDVNLPPPGPTGDMDTAMFGDAGVEESDEGVAPVCSPDEPCCDVQGQLRPQGTPCGTQALRAGCTLGTGTVVATVCSGASPWCTAVHKEEVPRVFVECLEGYHCPNPEECVWRASSL